MGLKERRNTEKAEMKKKIMNAAIKIIEQEGYEKLSIRKIAAEIEYSPTTIYLYYKDKAEIITDMSDELYRKVEDRAAVLLNDNTAASISEQIGHVLKSIVISLCDEAEMAKAVMYSGTNAIFGNKSADHKPTNSGIAMLDALLAEGIAKMVLRPNTANTSWMIMSALLGFVMSVIENQLHQLDHFDQLADSFIELMMGGLRQ